MQSDISDITSEMLKYHVDNRFLNGEIVKRSIRIFIEQFDPEKQYLLQSEVDSFCYLSEKEAADRAIKIKSDDFSTYWDLISVFQKAIVRQRTLRSNVIAELGKKEQLDLSYSLRLEEHNGFSGSEAELGERIKVMILNRIKIEGQEQGFSSLNKQNLIKQLELIDRKEKRFENIFLFENQKGKAVPKEKKENTFSTLVLKSIAKSLDPHTAFFSPEEAIAMRSSLQKQFKGIGVVIKEGVEGAYIGEIIPNSPAEKSQMIQKGDILIQINGRNVKDLSFEEVIEVMGKQDKPKVKLVLKRVKENHPPEQINAIIKKEVIIMEDDRLSYTTESVEGGIIGKITLTSFYDNGRGVTSEKDLRQAISNMEKQGQLKGLVIDLRNNSGGFLTQAVKVSGIFVPKGIIVISKYAHGEIQYSRDIDGKQTCSAPLVLLTSKASASAAEVVAQALQDYGVAIIAGDARTYGKGSMQIQNITDENAEAFFKVTVGRYYTISGRSTQIDGVLADVIVPSKYAPFDIGEKYLLYPLPRDELGFSFLDQEHAFAQYSKKDPRQIFSSYFPKQEQKWKKMIPILQENSKKRIEKNPDFQALSNLVNNKKKGFSFSSNMHQADPQMAEAINILNDMISLDHKN